MFPLASSITHSPFKTPRYLYTNQNWVQVMLDTFSPCSITLLIKIYPYHFNLLSKGWYALCIPLDAYSLQELLMLRTTLLNGTERHRRWSQGELASQSIYSQCGWASWSESVSEKRQRLHSPTTSLYLPRWMNSKCIHNCRHFSKFLTSHLLPIVQAGGGRRGGW